MVQGERTMEAKLERLRFKEKLLQFTAPPMRAVSTETKVDGQKASLRSMVRQARIHEPQMVQGGF